MSSQPLVYTLVPLRHPFISAPLVRPVFATRLGVGNSGGAVDFYADATNAGGSATDWYTTTMPSYTEVIPQQQLSPEENARAVGVVEKLVAYNGILEKTLMNHAIDPYEAKLKMLRNILNNKYGFQ